MDQLATDMASQRRHGVRNPYMFVDLWGYVPRWAVSESDLDGAVLACCCLLLHGSLRFAGDVLESKPSKEMQELANAILQGRGQAKHSKKFFTWCQWELAYSRFALAAEMVGMQSYTSCLSHLVRNLAHSKCSRSFATWLQVACQKVAESAENEGRRRWLAIIYDEVLLARI